MDEIAQIIEVALVDLDIDVSRLWNANPTTDPYIIYGEISENTNTFSDDNETSRIFPIDVDIYTTDPSTIGTTQKAIEEKLKAVGFIFKNGSQIIIEDENEPVWYHKPLEFEYTKEVIN